MKYISIAACGAFAAIVIGINWWVPINAIAASAQAGGPPLDEIEQDATNAFQGWSSNNNYLAKSFNVLYVAYGKLKSENAQLKDEIAKAKAATPPAPAPMSTPAPIAPSSNGGSVVNTPLVSPGPKP